MKLNVSVTVWVKFFWNDRLAWNIGNSPSYEDKNLICKPMHYFQIELNKKIKKLLKIAPDHLEYCLAKLNALKINQI